MIVWFIGPILMALLVPSIRRELFRVISGTVGYLAVFFDWLIFDLFGMYAPSAWVRIRPKLLEKYNKASRWFRVLAITIAVLFVALGVSVAIGWVIPSTIIAALLAIIVSTFFFPFNGLKTYLGLQPARTIGFILLSLLLFVVIQTNAPILFGSVWGWMTFGLICVATMIYVLGALFGTSSNVPHVVMTAIAGLIVFWSTFVVVFPQTARAMADIHSASQKDQALYALEKEKYAFVTKGKVTDKAIVWNLTFDTEGNVIGKTQQKDGEVKKFLEVGEKFMAKDATVKTYNAQGLYVEILLPFNKETDEYPLPDPDPAKRIFIDVNKTDLGSSARSETEDGGSMTDVTSSKMASNKVSVGQKFNYQVSALSFLDTGLDVTGHCVSIRVIGGQWKNHPNSGFNSGEGRGPYDEQLMLTVPTAPLSSLVGKTNSGSFYIGNSYQGNPGKGILRIGINDKEGYYEDNTGSLSVEIEILS